MFCYGESLMSENLTKGFCCVSSQNLKASFLFEVCLTIFNKNNVYKESRFRKVVGDRTELTN